MAADDPKDGPSDFDEEVELYELKPGDAEKIEELARRQRLPGAPASDAPSRD